MFKKCIKVYVNKARVHISVTIAPHTRTVSGLWVMLTSQWKQNGVTTFVVCCVYGFIHRARYALSSFFFFTL